MMNHPSTPADSAPFRAGYTLVELTIVLVILAVVAGGAFSAATSYTERNKERITEQRLDLIEQALYNYRQIHDRLPCPADGTQAPDSANYGIAAANPGIGTTGFCTGGTPAANFLGNAPSGYLQGAVHATRGNQTSVVGGTIPVVTLGLPKETGFDGWGNKITYHVDARATETGAFSHYTISNGNCFDVIVDDALSWNDESDRHYHSFHAVYALISHGKNGHGAFSRGGPRINAGSINPAENQNAKFSNTGTDLPYDNRFVITGRVEGATRSTDVYDDIVRYKTRDQLRTPQDGSGMVFPDLFVSAGASDGNGRLYAYYRCKDRFVMAAEEMIHPPSEGSDRPAALAVSPDNRFLLAGMGGNGYFRIWTFDGEKLIRLPESGTDCAFTPCSRQISQYGVVNKAQWSSDGEFFLIGEADTVSAASCPSGGGSNAVSIYNKSGTANFTRHNCAIQAPLSIGDLSLAKMNPTSNELLLDFARHRSESIRVNVLRRTANNSFVAIPPGEGGIHVEYDPYSTNPEPMHHEAVWSSDGSYLALLDQGGGNFLDLYRYEGNNTYTRISNPQPLPSSPHRVAFSPNGNLLVTASYYNNTMNFYQMGTDGIFRTIPDAPAATVGVTDVIKFSPDGKYLAIGKRGTATPSLIIYKVEGNRFTRLIYDTGPDRTPPRDITAIEWRQPAPWEKGQ